MSKKKDTSERGLFKEEIQSALFQSSDIKELLLGNTNDMSKKQVITNFQNHVKSHLFVDDTLTDADSYIFYDVKFPALKPHIKHCTVIMYAICHRSILDNYEKEGFYGNRADVLSQMIEEVLINDKDTVRNFGIGELSLDSVDIYGSERYYGCVMYFSVPNFR